MPLRTRALAPSRDESRPRSSRRSQVSAWVLAGLIATLWTVSVATPVAVARGHKARYGGLIVYVETALHKPVDHMMVLIRDSSGRVDSCTTLASGVALFSEVAAGEVIVDTRDKHWIERKKGAFIGTGLDTVRVGPRRTTSHVRRVTQRVPPAIYR